MSIVKPKLYHKHSILFQLPPVLPYFCSLESTPSPQSRVEQLPLHQGIPAKSLQADIDATNLSSHRYPEESYFLPTSLSLFPKLTCVCRTILNILTVFPNSNEFRIAQLASCQRGLPGHPQRLNQHNQFYRLSASHFSAFPEFSRFHRDLETWNWVLD